VFTPTAYLQGLYQTHNVGYSAYGRQYHTFLN